MPRTLFSCTGGEIALPDEALVLVSREDGGNLIVTPRRDVWDRGELTASELTLWSFLVAAAAKSMLQVLPQLEGGCINYWDAGNWALNDQAEPKGPKTGREHRNVHLHILGRSRTATSPSWRWGEAPRFPDFADRHAWAAKFQRLTADECRRIVQSVEALLVKDYGFNNADISPTVTCAACGYPMTGEDGDTCLHDR
jgi:hypothetical protein